MTFGFSARRRHVGTVAVLALIGTLSVPTVAAATSTATAAKVTERTFTCSGTLSDPGSFGVTGSLSASNVPKRLAVTRNGAALSTHPAPAVLLGTSVEH